MSTSGWGPYNAGAIISLLAVMIQVCSTLPPNERNAMTQFLRRKMDEIRDLDGVSAEDELRDASGLFVLQTILRHTIGTKTDAQQSPSSSNLWEEWEDVALGRGR